MTRQIWTIKEIIDWSVPFLKEKGSESPRLDAELLLAEVLSCRRIDLYIDHHKPLHVDERAQYRLLLQRRTQGEPIAYIIGRKDFYGFEFEVSSSTLIPRPDTEHLVEEILTSYPSSSQPVVGLDIGTGTGCIAISLNKLRPDWILHAWDLNQEALACAMRNQLYHQTSVKFMHCNALDIASWDQTKNKYDFIASNPPYIAFAERPELSRSVTDFEPEMALFAEDNGLYFYKIFARYAGQSLLEGGKIFLEIGSKQASDVCSILAGQGWRNIATVKDLAGLERVISAHRPP